MAKELPYYRFYVSEWITGDITLQDICVQGTFINVCAYYWHRNCSLTKAGLKARLSRAEASIEALIKSGIIKHDSISDEITIDFLNEQWQELYETHVRRSKSGKKGGKAKSKPGLSQPKAGLKLKDKDKDKIVPSFNFEESFEKFWQAYPKKVSKLDAEKAWKKLRPSEDLQTQIIKSISEHKLSDSWIKDSGQYVPHPATWLNGQKWNDEIEIMQKPGKMISGIDAN